MKALITMSIAVWQLERSAKMRMLNRTLSTSNRSKLRVDAVCRQLPRLAVIAALVSISGCGGPYDAKLRGQVTLDGKAVPRGTVSFAPVGGGPIAYSRIDTDGSYSAQTGREVGLPAGDYVVTVIANELPTVETPPG